MRIHVNLSQKTYEYFEGCDLSAIVDTLLEMYDFTHLPPISGKRYKEVTVDVNNQNYIDLYNTLGPRSKLVSLSRLFEFAAETDVLSLDRFKVFKVERHDDPTFSLIDRAYRTLLTAKKYDESEDLEYLIKLVYTYRQIKAEERSKHDDSADV